MKKLKKITIILFPLILLSLFIYFLVSTKIEEFSCKSQFGECSPIIIEKISDISSCNYLNCKEKIDIVLSDAWLVDKYSYQIKLPLRIDINIIEKKPKYSLRTSLNDYVAQIDSKGMVINIRKSTGLPGLIIDEKIPNLGEKVNDKMLFALEMVYGVSKIQTIENASLIDNHLSVDMGGERNVLFPLTGDRDFLLGALTLILNELKKNELNSRIEGVDRVRTIDLRYKNPILN